ncbi:MAG: hypothetical protein EOM23_00630 [Candidatus Moranbacteria bacterium]|nr:hypothetical protein [Candidatus Moranbacteria bacterium]
MCKEWSFLLFTNSVQKFIKEENELYSLLFLLGSPGVGKTTHALLLAYKLACYHIDASDLLKKFVKENLNSHDEQKKADAIAFQEAIANGRLTDRAKTWQLITEEIQKLPNGTTVIISGYPRDKEYFAQIDFVKYKVLGLIFLTASRKTIKKRLLKQKNRIDSNEEAVKARLAVTALMRKAAAKFKALNLLIIVGANGALEENRIRVLKAFRFLKRR